MFGFSLIDIIAGIPGLIMALVVHEYAHARVAVTIPLLPVTVLSVRQKSLSGRRIR